MERLQRTARNQLQLVQHCSAVGRARHPQVSTPRVDLDRRDLLESGGVGAHEVDRMIRALADDNQLASELIAEEESVRHRVVCEASQDKTLGRESDRFWGRRR